MKHQGKLATQNEQALARLEERKRNADQELYYCSESPFLLCHRKCKTGIPVSKGS